MTIFLGIDPGASGGIAVLDSDAREPGWVFPMPKTESDLEAEIAKWRPTVIGTTVAAIERVGGIPGQAAGASFKFGRSAGVIVGLLIAHKIPFVEVSPGKWMRHFGLYGRNLTKTQRKNASKALAQKRFPGIKLTHATAEALLLALYAKETYK